MVDIDFIYARMYVWQRRETFPVRSLSFRQMKNFDVQEFYEQALEIIAPPQRFEGRAIVGRADKEKVIKLLHLLGEDALADKIKLDLYYEDHPEEKPQAQKNWDAIRVA